MRLPSGALFISEDPQNAKLARLRKAEHIDAVVAPFKTDLDKLTALARWTSAQFPETTPFPHYPAWNASVILKKIRSGKTGGFCAQYAFVFGQCAQSLGYSVRYWSIASRTDPAGHFLPEVYLPSEARWIAFEPMRGVRYIDDQNRPLGVFDLHQYAVGIREGPVLEWPTHRASTPNNIALFYGLAYQLRNNFLTLAAHVAVKNSAEGPELFFSPYRLRYLDSVNKNQPWPGDSYVSSDPRDFVFPFDTRHYEHRTCWTAVGFFRDLSPQSQGHVLRIRMPQNLFASIMRDLIADPAFVELKCEIYFPLKSRPVI